jgi:predicted dehydrogenase
MNQAVRFAVVGVLGYSRSHLRYVHTLAERGRGRLAASVMIDKDDHPDIVAEFKAANVRVFDNYAAMLKACQGEVDVVTLPVPIHLHAPMSIAAFQAGYHVYVEKPVAGSLSEVDEMIAAREASGVQCAVGFQQLYSPVYRRLKRYVVEGRLGQVRRISIMALWPRAPAYYARNNWAGKLTCDGRPVLDSPFNNALAHQIMNMLYLASPEPQSVAYPVRVEADLARAYDIESFDTGCMRVRTQNDVEIIFVATHACQVNVQPTMKLEAESASVNWTYGGDATVTYADGRIEILPKDSPHVHMIENIADAVTGAVAEPACTLEIARAHVACIEAVHRAAEIETIPAHLISEGDGGQRAIVGIDKAVRQVYESGKLFSELNVPFIKQKEDRGEEIR